LPVTTIALRMRFVLVTKRYLGKMTILVVAIHGRWTNPRTRDESLVLEPNAHGNGHG
jgi:hypothetical protein